MKKGIVIKSTGSWYYIKNKEGVVVPCKIKGTYRIKGIRATNPVAVGDFVIYRILQNEQTGVIEQIHTRKNYIIRRSPKLSKEYQLIAANIDQAVLMITLIRPKTMYEFIDRFLVSAEAFRIPVLLLFNKTDIYDESTLQEMKELISTYEQTGYQCLDASLKNQINIDLIVEHLTNKTSVIAGNSGVGKTTLLNMLDPGLKLKTMDVSDHHKSGQHATTFAEMFFLSSGIRLIDTPGIKGFGMVDIEKDELFHFFPEIFKFSAKCKYNNCMHLNEPECAVMKAIEQGKIRLSRYRSYISMLEDLGDKYRK